MEIPVGTFASFDWLVDRFIDCRGVSEWIIDLYLWSCSLYVLILSNNSLSARPHVLSFFIISISTPSCLVFRKALKALKTLKRSTAFPISAFYEN